MTQPTESAVCIDRRDIENVFASLQGRGYTLVGPSLREGAIGYEPLESVQDLPIGWTDEQEAGVYRVKKRDDKALFGYNLGPHSWKKFLFPPRKRLWHGKRTGDGGFESCEETAPPPRYAFIGVRACELRAIQIQDRVFLGGAHQDPTYADRRANCFILAVNCGQAASTCFCVSMETGPEAGEGYDIALTEIIEGDLHYFLARAGTEKGREILRETPSRRAEESDLQLAADRVNQARRQMKRSMDPVDLKELLYRNYESPRWAELENRCLACANCTMVCPTCFCSKVEDVTDLTGDHAERWQTWDSCFTLDFSRLHGGGVRQTVRSRYRQWLTHKLGTWHDQFGSSGCVGCGRCVTWCPVGIDLTAEVCALRKEEKGDDHG
jgi:ferredoxin